MRSFMLAASAAAYRPSPSSRTQIADLARPEPFPRDATPDVLQSDPGYFEAAEGNSRTQMLRKLIGGLGSPWACSLIGAESYFL